MKKGVKIGIGIGSVVLVLGAFVLYRKSKINKSVKKLKEQGFTFEGCQNGRMEGTKQEFGKTVGTFVPCGIFKF